jgi:hypothetical protein
MITNGGFLTMGTKRVGLARIETLLENLKRPVIDMNQRRILRASDFESNAYTLTRNDTGKVILLDEDAATTITMPAVTTADIGITYTIIETVASDADRTINTAYNNDYWVGGVANLTTAVEAGSKPFVVAAATNTQITFDDNLQNGAGALGSYVRLTAILAGNTEAGGGAKLVWLVEGAMGTADPNGTGAAIFT